MKRKRFKEEQIIEMSPEEVVQAVRKYPCKHLVLTGGEPLMQQKDFARTTACAGARPHPDVFRESPLRGKNQHQRNRSLTTMPVCLRQGAQ